MPIRILLLVTILLTSLSFPQTADAHSCPDNGKMEHSMVMQSDSIVCEHNKVDHDTCCADMTLLHCSGGAVLFIGEASSVNTIRMKLSSKVDSPLDTLVRAKHASNLFRPPIVIA